MAQKIWESIEVQAPVQGVGRYWSYFENYSVLMSNVEEVSMTGQHTSHWKMKRPLGKSVRFEA